MKSTGDGAMAWPNPEEWESQPDSGFLAHVGPLRRRRGPSFVYGVLMDDRHRGPEGLVAAGMVLTLADRGMGAAARQDDPSIRQATAQLNVDFVAPAQTGAPLEVECEVMSRAGLLVYVRGMVKQRERLVATASGVWKVFQPRARTSDPLGAMRAPAETPEPATAPSESDWRGEPASDFHAHVGPFLHHETQALRYGFMADDRHRNRRGVVQGGMTSTLAEYAMGAAASGGLDHAGSAPPVPVNLNINFLAAADPGRLVEADCAVTRRTRSLIFVEAALRQGSSIVATASGIWRPRETEGDPR